jgi:deazaflavin-dependent oxidoreductase (nitroreductase family)
MPLDHHTTRLLASIRTIDMTTIGRKSGRPSRIEIWWFHFEEKFIVTGTPGPRHWMANITADPTVMVHAEGDDHIGTAVVIGDRDFRHRFFTHRDPEIDWYSTQAERETLIETAPMIEIRF